MGIITRKKPLVEKSLMREIALIRRERKSRDPYCKKSFYRKLLELKIKTDPEYEDYDPNNFYDSVTIEECRRLTSIFSKPICFKMK